jgi:hypothetical protein
MVVYFTWMKVAADIQIVCGTVFDLPQLYNRPTAESLLETLDLIAIVPQSWDRDAKFAKKYVQAQGLPNYLTSIISSPLDWIPDEPIKENIWKAASLRLSERSGRTGGSWSVFTYSGVNC